MRTDEYDSAINTVVTAQETNRSQYRTPSGRISASMMGKPVLWNVLKLMGIPTKEFDPYLLRKFARGIQAEEWFTGNLIKSEPFRYTTQQRVSYRGGIGYVDLAENKQSYIKPHEVKSVTNMKFKRLTKGFVRKDIQATGVDLHHALQAAYYALANESPDFTIHYVASDDLRVASYELITADYQVQIDDMIDRIEDALSRGQIPEFESVVDWQNNKTYWDYPELYGMNAMQIETYLQANHKQAYDRLKSKEVYDHLKRKDNQ